MELVAVLFVGCILWLLVKAAASSGQRSAGTIEVTLETRGSSSARARDRHRSHEEAYEDGQGLWVPPGESISVHGRTLSDGMVYAGPALPAVDRYRDTDPALINPRLRADSQRPDRSGQHLDYWPSYDSIPRSSRAAYLDWLADGRRAPDTPIGYVFLFFYGLERRILVDADVSDEARAEVPELVAEIDELLSVYGDRNGSFQGYASRFLQYARLAHGLTDVTGDGERAAADERSAVLWTVGRHVSRGEPIPSSWAARFARSAASQHLRTPAKRCPDAFLRLFKVRYEAEYGEGLKVRADGPPLEVSYRTASSGMQRTFSHATDEAVDARKIDEVRGPLVRIAQEVEPEIDDYSRWIGRRHDRNSPAAVGLLPRPVVRDFAGEEARELADRIEGWLGDDERVVIPSQRIVDAWPTKNDSYMTGKEAEAFSGFLEGFGFGVEPDVRYSRNPSKRDHLAIFRLPGEVEPPGEKFEAARLLLHLAAAVAGADEEIAAEEERHIEAHLESALELNASERARLRAHLVRRLEHPPTLHGVRRRAEELTERQRHTLARFLVTVAGADGHLDHAEVEVLEKIYDTLELDPDTVHADLHDMAARVPGDRGPVVVVEGDEDDSGHEIPEPRDPEEAGDRYSDGVTLDMDRLADVQAETRDVSRRLAGVFAGDEGEEPPPEHRVDLGIDGLSEGHRTLLDALMDGNSCSRSQFETLAEEEGLMPGFAIEQINSVSLEACGEPLLEGDDPVELNPYALEELQR